MTSILGKGRRLRAEGSEPVQLTAIQAKGSARIVAELHGFVLVIHGQVFTQQLVGDIVVSDGSGEIRRTSMDPWSEGTASFAIMVPTLPLPPQFVVDVDVEVGVPVRRVRIAEIRGRAPSIRGGVRPELAPVVVNGVPRSGTTRLMSLLVTHPQLVGARVYPFESRHAVHLLHSLAVLTSPADRVGSAQPHSMSESMGWAGASPYFSPTHEAFPFLQERYVLEMAEAFTGQLESIYRHIASVNSQPSPQAFIEKFCPPAVINVARKLYPRVHEVLLVRDPRDVFCSIRSFNHKRGLEGFAQGQFDSELEWLQHCIAVSRSMLDDYADRWSEADRAVFRYADLLSEPAALLRRVCSGVGIRADQKVVDGMLDQAETFDFRTVHSTTSSTASSVGRWRRDLARDLVERTAEEMKEFEHTFARVAGAVPNT